MSPVDMLRLVVTERLAAAAGEIFAVFERALAEYEEELSRSKRKNEQQRKLLDAVLKPEVRLHRAVLYADVQQGTEPPHIQEEQEGEQLRGPDSGKSEDDEAQSSQLHQKQEENIEAEPPASSRTSDFCKSETRDSEGEETRKPQSDLRKLTNDGVAEGGKERNAAKKSFSCSKCGKKFKANRKSAPGMDPSVCSVCVQGSTQSARLITKTRTHSGETVFRCSVCKKLFSYKGDAVRHIRIHTGEKPFSCSVCGKRFTQSTGLRSHMRTHTGEKPFSCSFCPKQFNRRGVLDRHMRVHTGEKPYSCSECNTSFSLSQSLLKHMRIHTGEKPFSCSVCNKKFTQKGHLTQHMALHTREKSFSCHVCGRKFTRQSRVNNHRCVPESSSK